MCIRDSVIADPEMNRLFLNRCRELGLGGTDFELNWKLFNGRKASLFSNMPKTRRYTPGKIDDFEFSSEIAFVHVKKLAEKRSGTELSLDRMLCDPDLACEFDKIASQLMPGFQSLEYRWVALGIRKAAGRNLKKAIKLAQPKFDLLGSTKSVRASRIPKEQGLYLFSCQDQPLFVSHTNDLRNRIERHFDSSENAGIPSWLFDRGRNAIKLGVVPLESVSQSQRKLLGLKAVSTLEPSFNYVCKA